MTPCLPPLPAIKQGDTFSVGGTFTGMAAATTVTARINDPMNAHADVADLVVTLGPFVDLVTPRTLLLECLDTSSWPVGALAGDLKFVEAGGFTIHSRTFTQPVARAETP